MGQTMLIIGAFSLLSILSLSINGTMIGTVVTGLEAQAQLNAYSFAQSLMDEILSKHYDRQVVDGTKIFNAANFTSAANFGPDAGETLSPVSTPGVLRAFGLAVGDPTNIDTSYASRSLFDDVDDYHNYRRAVEDSVLGWFAVTALVEYVSEANPDSVSANNTHFKRVTVSVTHPNFPKTINETGEEVTIPVIIKDLAIYRRYF